MSEEVEISRLKKALRKISDDAQSRYMQAILLSTEYAALHEFGYKGHKPDIMVGPIPIFTVQKEGHASSDEILKYRSMGTIFLAHQQGGKKTFTFTVKAFGPSRLILLIFLKGLLISGMQTNKSISSLGLKATEDADIGIDATKKIHGAYNTITDYIRRNGDWKEETIGYHRTIPIITGSKIYLNMYLETLRYRESVDLGINCMEIQCAFREFIAPTHARVVKPKGLEEKKGKKAYFDAWLDGSELKSIERYDNIINILWGSRKAIKEFIYNPNLTQHQRNTYGMEAVILIASASLLEGYLST